jgi:hypothetical protein
MSEVHESAPSTYEMQAMLERPVGVDFHPLVSSNYRCARCGSEKANWWYVLNGERMCDRCAVHTDTGA